MSIFCIVRIIFNPTPIQNIKILSNSGFVVRKFDERGEDFCRFGKQSSSNEQEKISGTRVRDIH